VWRANTQLGFAAAADDDALAAQRASAASLFGELEQLMTRSRADYTLLWRALADVADAAADAGDGGAADEALLAAVAPSFYEPLHERLQPAWTAWLRKVGAHRSLVSARSRVKGAGVRDGSVVGR